MRFGWASVVFVVAALVAAAVVADSFGQVGGDEFVADSGVQEALTPEEADGDSNATEAPEDATPAVVPLRVADPARYAQLKQEADQQIPPEEQPSGDLVDLPIEDPFAEAQADQALEDPEDLPLPVELSPTDAEVDPPVVDPALLDPAADEADTLDAAAARVQRVPLNERGLAASSRNKFVPPDSTGAIGPGSYVEMVNSRIAVYRRTNLSRVAETSLRAFVAARRGDRVFDPQIQWDPQANRFFYLADRVRGSVNYLAFGWSKTSSPRNLSAGGWCKFFYRTGDEFEDYVKLGHSRDYLVFGSNVFSPAGFSPRISALPKPPTGSTNCVRPRRRIFGSPANPLLTADGNRAGTPIPVNTFTTSVASAEGYVVAADDAPATQIMTWHVVRDPAAPATDPNRPALVPDGNIDVPAYQMPPRVTQPRTRLRIDTLDGRLTQAVADIDPQVVVDPLVVDPQEQERRRLAIWTQQTVRAPDGRSLVRWYELLPRTRTVRQRGDIQERGRFAFNGAISPTTLGTAAAMNYNVGGRRLLVRSRARWRDATNPLNATVGPVTLGRSAAAVRDFSCFDRTREFHVCRWGDYAGASPDPLNQTLVWGSNQLQGPRSNQTCVNSQSGARGPCPSWRTRNFAVRATPSRP